MLLEIHQTLWATKYAMAVALDWLQQGFSYHGANCHIRKNLVLKSLAKTLTMWETLVNPQTRNSMSHMKSSSDLECKRDNLTSEILGHPTWY